MSQGLVAKKHVHSKNNKWFHKLGNREEDRERGKNSGRLTEELF